MMFPVNAVHVSGEPTYFDVKGDSGRRMTRGFCQTCGSQLFALLEALPNALGIRAGTLDDPSLFSPTMDFYASSAAPWDVMNGELRKCARAPER